MDFSKSSKTVVNPNDLKLEDLEEIDLLCEAQDSECLSDIRDVDPDNFDEDEEESRVSE